ncbi:Uncharacterized protein Fot_32532 [Forsythia ovata]|uniref:Uncharacterized protein n=1 Tax=Forsythia ovata TaxID=205694 RepID=A0ABD1T880_9LAMI
MDEKFKLIPDIYPTQRDWTTKVLVTEKLAPKIAKQNQSRYQHMILMDLKMAVDKQQIFYVKATQGLPNKTEYKFEIIFVLDTCLAITEIEHSKVDKGKGLLYPDLPTKLALIEEVSPPPAKKSNVPATG